jgi:hypothetical protein
MTYKLCLFYFINLSNIPNPSFENQDMRYNSVQFFDNILLWAYKTIAP